MTKVFQDKFGIGHGNCMSAVIASLFDLKLEEVPYFIGEDHWFEVYCKFIKEQGYEYDGILYNPKCLGSWGDDRFSEIKDSEEEYFDASVYSPYLFDRNQFINNPNYSPPLHAVIIDKNFNIVHDPHPHYQGVKKYPMHEWIGYNGIVNIWLISKIK